METVVKVDAVRAAKGAGTVVRVRMTRLKALRARMVLAGQLLRWAERVGCFRLEFLDQAPVPRHDRRRELPVARRRDGRGRTAPPASGPPGSDGRG